MLRKLKLLSMRLLRLTFFICVVFGGSGLLYFMKYGSHNKFFNITLHPKSHLCTSMYLNKTRACSTTISRQQQENFANITRKNSTSVTNFPQLKESAAYEPPSIILGIDDNEKSYEDRKATDNRQLQEFLSKEENNNLPCNNHAYVEDASTLEQSQISSTAKLHTIQANHTFYSSTESSFDARIYVNETEEEFLQRMEIRMEHRRNIAKQACQRLGINPSNKSYEVWSTDLPSPWPWMFISTKYGLIYNEIPKTGCSNWKKVLMVLNGLANSTKDIGQGESHASNIGFVNHYPSNEEKEIYSEMTKLMVVRDPMERIVSAFVDKVGIRPNRQTPIFPKFSSEVAKKYGSRWTDPTKHFPDGTKSLTTCEVREADLLCATTGEVIKILNATFGRYDNETCGFESRWNGQRCSSKRAYYVTSQLCDGKRECEVVASQAQFGVVTECPSISKYLTIAYQCISLKEKNTVTTCNNEVHSIKCPTGKVISIWSAFYGRNNRETCSFRGNVLNTECSSDVATAMLMSECNGKSTCTINVTPEWFQATDLCPATTKYLQVWFTCAETTEQNASNVGNGETQIWPTSEKQNRKSIYKPSGYIGRKYDLQATFDEFVSYLLDPANNKFSKDVLDHGSAMLKQTSVRHWDFFYILGYPCHIEYDVIAHTETIEEDARYLLKLIKAPPNLHYPEGYGEAGRSLTTSDYVRNLLLSLDANKLKKLLEKYKPDYEIFGYSIPKYLNNNVVTQQEQSLYK